MRFDLLGRLEHHALEQRTPLRHQLFAQGRFQRGGPGGQQQNTALSPEAALAASRDEPAPAGPTEYQELKYHSPYGFFYASTGNPVIKPPWSTLTAYDLSVPKILWQKPIGTVPWYGDMPTGTAQSKGGILITAGGLIFSSSNSDRKIHAWNKDTGDLVWEGNLPSAGQGRPITYMINGVQYLAVPAAGGGGQPDLAGLGEVRFYAAENAAEPPPIMIRSN